MAVSEAQKKASVRYLEKLDEVRIRMPKGRKADIKAHAEAQGESVNGFINRAIDHQISQDRDKGPSEAPQDGFEAGAVLLPSEAYKRAVEASTASGEDLPEFVARAVTTQAQRDAAEQELGGGG